MATAHSRSLLDTENTSQQSIDQANKNTNQQQSSDDFKQKRPIFDKSLGTAAGLSKLLPTGTTLAFQTLAPSFTRGGECVDHDVNFAFTWGLIIFLTLLSAALNFTDSVTVTSNDGSTTHYGVVTSKSLRLFNGRELVRQSKVDKNELRNIVLQRLHLLHSVSVQEENFIQWWLSSRKRVSKTLRRGFDSAFFLVGWSLWKERNARTFERAASTPPAIAARIREEAASWCLAGNKRLRELMVASGILLG